MIALWIPYCAAVGLLLTGGGLALERALRACALPTRWAWLAAMLLTLAIPVAVRALPSEAPAPSLPRVAAPAGAAGERISPAEVPLAGESARRVDLAALDRPLLVAWGAASGATLLVLLAMAAVLRHRRARWRAEELAGVPVLVSRDTGPAVVGLFRSRIVLPEWAAGTDPERRGLLLEHELEHLRAGDPRLLAAGLAALVLLPWNPAVWWQLRRLRLAVEVDCDARVLRRRGDVRAYGSLLLEVGRRAGGSALAAASFSEPASFLERRIRIMTTPRERSPWTRAAGFGALTLGLVAAACETPAPTSIAPAPVERVYAAADAPQDLQAARLSPRDAVARYFPDVLTEGVEANTVLTFVVDHRGEVVHSSRAKHETFVATRTRSPAASVAPAPEGSGTRVRLRDSGVSAEVGERGRFRLSAARDVEVDPDQIESVDVMKFPAGAMGPTAVDVIWIRKRDPAAPPAPSRVRVPAPGGGEELVVAPSRGEAVLRRNTAAGAPEAGGAQTQTGGGQMVFRAVPDTGGRPVRVDLRSRTRAEPGVMVTTGVPTGAPDVASTDPAVIVRAIEKHHPSVARGQATPEMVWFVVGADGEVVRTGTNRGPGFNDLVPDRIEAMEVFKGDKIQVNGRSVTALWIRLKA